MLCFVSILFNPRSNYTMTCFKQIIRGSKSTVIIAAHIGRKLSYLFMMSAESQQHHPLSHFSVSYSFIKQNASNNETMLICLLSLYIVSVFIGLCFYLNLYLSALSAYSASVSHTHRHIYTHVCMHTNTQIYINTHTGMPENMHTYSRLLFNSRICINTNTCSINNINEGTCTKKIINNYMNMPSWL